MKSVGVCSEQRDVWKRGLARGARFDLLVPVRDDPSVDHTLEESTLACCDVDDAVAVTSTRVVQTWEGVHDYDWARGVDYDAISA